MAIVTVFANLFAGLLLIYVVALLVSAAVVLGHVLGAWARADGIARAWPR